MHERLLGSVAIAVAAAIVLVPVAPRAAAPQTNAAPQPPAAAARDLAEHKATLTQYCVTCHNDRTKTSGLSLGALDLSRIASDAEMWERVVRKLRVGAMPPHGMKRPDAATADRLIAWLEGELDRTAVKPYPGRFGIRWVVAASSTRR